MTYDKTAGTVTPITLTSNIYNNIDHTLYGMYFRRHGILKASGYVKFTITETATVTINPFIYQANHPELGFSGSKDAGYNEVSQRLTAGTYVFPLEARLHVFPSNHNEQGAGETQRTAEAKFRLRGKLSKGTMTIESYRTYLDYTPTDKGIAYEILDFTGKEELAEGSDFSIIYPDPVKYSIEGEASPDDE